MRLTEKNELADFTSLKYKPKKPIYLDYDKGDAKTAEELLNKLGQYEDIEEKAQWNELGIDLITLVKIVSFGQKIFVDENKVGTFYEKDKWKRVKCFIPVSFNIDFIYCDVWYEDNFGGVMDNLVIPISEYKKTWTLSKEELEDDK